jgi:hypothetical protein
VIAPVWVIAPVEVTVRVPVPTLDAPSFVATALVSATLFAPLLFSDDGPGEVVGLGEGDRVGARVEGRDARRGSLGDGPGLRDGPVELTVKVPVPTLEVAEHGRRRVGQGHVVRPAVVRTTTGPVKSFACVSVDRVGTRPRRTRSPAPSHDPGSA